MSGKAYYNATERCWYVPVAPELLDAEELRAGIKPVAVQFKDGQLWITRLEPAGREAA